MEKIIIGKTIPVLTAKTIDDLVVGDVALMLYPSDENASPFLRGSEVTDTELQTAKSVQFLVKKANGELDGSLLLPNNRVVNRNYKAYTPGVAGVYTIGDSASVNTALTIPTTGEGIIRLIELKDTNEIDNFPAIISETKKSTETALTYLTRVVTRINNHPIASKLVTASLVTNTGSYHITLTTLSHTIKLGIALSDIFANYAPITTTPRVIAVGTGASIAEIEKRLTIFNGNGNYVENGDLYYKEPLVTDTSKNYNVLSITATKEASPTPSTTMTVANVNVLVALPSNITTLATIYNAYYS